MEEAKYSATFRMDVKGTEVQFTVRSEGKAAEHLASLQEYFGLLVETGVVTKSTREPLAEDEIGALIDGYIVGQTQKGDECVWLYCRGDRAQYKFTTVYKESHDRGYDKLWFTVDSSRAVSFDSAPPPAKARAMKNNFVSLANDMRFVVKLKEGSRFLRVAAEDQAYRKSPAGDATGDQQHVLVIDTRFVPVATARTIAQCILAANEVLGSESFSDSDALSLMGLVTTTVTRVTPEGSESQRDAAIARFRKRLVDAGALPEVDDEEVPF